MCWDDLLTLFAIVGQFPYTAPSTNTSGMVGNGRGRQGGRREEEIEDDDEPTDSGELVEHTVMSVVLCVCFQDGEVGEGTEGGEGGQGREAGRPEREPGETKRKRKRWKSRDILQINSLLQETST